LDGGAGHWLVPFVQDDAYDAATTGRGGWWFTVGGLAGDGYIRPG
jgi:hypothetical protein